MPCHTHGGMKCAVCISSRLPEGYAGLLFLSVLREVNIPAPTKCKSNPGLGIYAGPVASPCYEGCMYSEHETATNSQARALLCHTKRG